MQTSLTANEIDQVAELLTAGKVVAVPTETVYGLAADIRCDEAVKAIFALKGRPQTHPLIIHISEPSQLDQYARDIPHYLPALMTSFWPGPLTVVLKKTDWVSDLVTGGQSTVAIRLPAHPLTRQVIQRVGGAIAAPSANRFGHISPTTAQHVLSEFDAQVPVLDGGRCDVGIESTILDTTLPDRVTILRPGMITANQLRDAFGLTVTVDNKQQPSLNVSGTLPYHYEPNKPTYFIENLAQFRQLQADYQDQISLLSQSCIPQTDNLTHVIPMPLSASEYARQLYQALREADNSRSQIIVIEAPKQAGSEWLGILDRLQKATARTAQTV